MDSTRIINKNVNPLLDCALITCAACYQKCKEGVLTDDLVMQLSHVIGSAPVSGFFSASLENLLNSYVWAQAEIWISMAYERIDKQALSEQELQALVILNKVIPRLFWKNDFAYLYDMVNYFCKGEALIMLNNTCPEECRKISEAMMGPSEAAAWGVIGE